MIFPEYTPVSQIQKNYGSVLKKTELGPVILAHYSKPVAVIMSASDYERFAGMEVELKRLQRIVKADRDFAEMRQGKYTLLTDELAANNADPSQ
jgi:prevent-host-death family protein